MHSSRFGSHRSRPLVADKADVEHELVPRVLVVLQDDGVTHHFVALDVGSHYALHELCLGNDVGADVTEGFFRDDHLFFGRLAPYSRAERRVKLGEEDGSQRPLLAATLFPRLPSLPSAFYFHINTRHH